MLPQAVRNVTPALLNDFVALQKDVGLISVLGAVDAVRAAQGFRWGSTGPGAEDYVTASLLNAVFGIDAQIVTGFPGSGETELAILQGSVQIDPGLKPEQVINFDLTPKA